MAIKMTEAAIERVREIRRMRQSEGDLFRLGVKSGGCNGLNYYVDIVSEAQPDDKVFRVAPDLEVCVDRKSYLYVNGTEVDFVGDIMQSRFEFRNPLAQAGCSCGDSFNL